MNADQTDDSTESLWTIHDVANELGMTRSSAVTWLANRHVSPVYGGGRGYKCMYDPDEVRAAKADQLRRAKCRANSHRWG